LRRLLDAGLCRSAAQFPAIGSTNQVALRESPETVGGLRDAFYPRLIVADQQTAGRGRQGRAWHADQGTLTFSWIAVVTALQLPEEALPVVALAAGMAVADAIESTVPPYQCRLKWPNDVHIGRGKVAGILVESSTLPPRRLVIGIGVNVATDLTGAGEDVQRRGESLTRLTGRSLQRYDLLPPIVECLNERLVQLRDAPEPLLEGYRRRCVLTGRLVCYQQGQVMRRGTVRGVDAAGALQIATAEGTETVRSGEVHFQWNE
jgi:BirA family biotin operon repressor/biotin-[acetyl-CoA-carboxylase] ligase